MTFPSVARRSAAALLLVSAASTTAFGQLTGPAGQTTSSAGTGSAGTTGSSGGAGTPASTTPAPASTAAGSSGDSSDQGSGMTGALQGFTLPASDKLRFTIDFMAGYGTDRANATLGFERQGRVGYAIFSAFGQLTPRISYSIAVNPVDEVPPVPACGSAGFFYPNDPKFLYGPSTTIACDPADGDRRVDPYRGIALDVLEQQGPIREAWIAARLPWGFTARAGRMPMPIGFDWQEAGSFTAKDAPLIQRIDSQSNFGAMLTWASPATSRTPPRVTASLDANLGDTNRIWDYDYFYFEDSSLATNSQLTYLGSLRAVVFPRLEIRTSYQHGDTGSKVEREPSYWASKRNDDATLFGLELRPTTFSRVIYEQARYLWGPRPSSALMLNVDPSPIRKNGFYTTAEAWWPMTSRRRLGMSLSYERIDRDDSLIRWLAEQHLYNVTTNQLDRMTVGRVYFDVNARMRLGFYRTIDHNPFPWVSGISSITGPSAFKPVDTDKWGLMLRIQAR
jgi:hypothetical protein